MFRLRPRTRKTTATDAACYFLSGAGRSAPGPARAILWRELAFLLDLVCSRANWLAYIAVAVMPVLICADVVGRLLHTGVPGALELQENLLVLTTYGLMGWLQSRGRCMSIDFVYKHM